MNDKKQRMIKNIIVSIAVPLAVFGLMQILCRMAVQSNLITKTNYMMFIRNLTSTTLLALGLSCNVTSGRFDFSLGAVRLAAVIIGGNIAIGIGLNGVAVVILAAIFGFLFSGFVGVMYCLTHIAPIVLSLAMTLLYESLGFFVFHSEGLNLLKATGDMSMLSSPVFMVIIIIIAVVVVNFLSQNTSYGYHRRALATGQSVAVNSGINEKRNAILCYAISGALFATAGVISASYQGIMSPSLDLASVGTVFTAMLPVFVGGFMASFSTDTIGTFMASLTVAFMNIGLTVLGLSETERNLINAVVLIGFLMFSYHATYLTQRKQLKKRAGEALAKIVLEK